MITLTDIHMQRLHAEAARLSKEADRRLAAAEDTDDPDDWDAWKEADGIAAGYKLALQDVVREAANPDPTCIWTLVDGDDDDMYVLSGCHLVDRLGYFITERPWAGDDPVEILVD